MQQTISFCLTSFFLFISVRLLHFQHVSQLHTMYVATASFGLSRELNKKNKRENNNKLTMKTQNIRLKLEPRTTGAIISFTF